MRVLVGQPQDGVMLPLTAITITIAYLAALGAARKVKFIFMLNGNGDGVDDDDDDDMCANVNTQQTDTHTVTNVLSSGAHTHTPARTLEAKEINFVLAPCGVAQRLLASWPRRFGLSRTLHFFFLATTERAIIDNATRPEADPQAGSRPSSESASQARPSQASSGQLLYTNFLWLFGSLYRVLLFSVPLTLSADGSL